MKYIWEADDIAVGMRLLPASGSKQEWMIGYRPDILSKTRLILVSLTDGMAEPYMYNSETLAKKLTDEGFKPLN